MIKLKIFIQFQTKCLCSKFITLFNSLHEPLQYLAVMQNFHLLIATGPKNIKYECENVRLQSAGAALCFQRVQVRGCGSLINGFSMFHPHQQQQPDTGQTADSNREQSDNGHIQHRQGSIVHHNVLGSE